jgi:hypothetical protein
MIQTAVFAACPAGLLHAAPEVGRIYFNGKDFRGGQLIMPKLKTGAEQLKKRNFAVRSEVFPAVGHVESMDDHDPLIRECFLPATDGILPVAGRWAGNLQPFARRQTVPATPDR